MRGRKEDEREREEKSKSEEVRVVRVEDEKTKKCERKKGRASVDDWLNDLFYAGLHVGSGLF